MSFKPWLLLVAVAACTPPNPEGGDDPNKPNVPGPTGQPGDAPPGNEQPGGGSVYALRGTLSGLSGGELGLRLNGQALPPITTNGTFTASATLKSGTPYDLTVAAQPLAQICVITGGTGTIGTADVVNVSIVCASTTPSAYSIGGVITGLESPIQLSSQGETITVSPPAATFTFTTKRAAGMPYSVQIAVPPTDQFCTITGGDGTVVDQNITTVSIVCDPPAPRYQIGGQATLTLASTPLQLRAEWMEGGALQSQTVNAFGAFHFQTEVPNGSVTISVQTSPNFPSQTCTVDGGASSVRVVADADIDDLMIVCSINSFTLSVGVSGISGISGSLSVTNGASMLTVSTNGTHTFPAALPSLANYNVQVTAPAGVTCSNLMGMGTIIDANVVVQVTCTRSYSVTVAIADLNGDASITLNHIETLPLTAGTTSATFNTKLPNAWAYQVAMTSPAGQICRSTAPSGQVMGDDVLVIFSCEAELTLTVSFTGLVAGSGSTLPQLWEGVRNVGITVPTGSTGGQLGGFVAGDDYQVYLVEHPTRPWQLCDAIPAGTFAGTNVVVTSHCTTRSFSVHVTATMDGLSGLKVTNNGGNELTLFGDGERIMSGSQLSGTTYDVQISQLPIPKSSCSLQNASGEVLNEAPLVTATCKRVYTVGGTVSGRAGGAITLGVRKNAGPVEQITISGAGDGGSYDSATFFDPMDNYEVTVVTPPPGRRCTPTSRSGVMGPASVPNADFTCVIDGVAISGVVYGNLSGIVISNDGVETLSAITGTTGGTGFSFVSEIPFGSDYDITVDADRKCFVVGGTGHVGQDAPDVTNVIIDCGMRYETITTEDLWVPQPPVGQCNAGAPPGSLSVNVTDSLVIADVQVDIDLLAEWAGDIAAKVIGPSQVPSVIDTALLNFPETSPGVSNHNTLNGLFQFASFYPANLHATILAAGPGVGNPVPGGQFQPEGNSSGTIITSLRDHAGRNAQGTWELQVFDTCFQNGSASTMAHPAVTIYRFVP